MAMFSASSVRFSNVGMASRYSSHRSAVSFVHGLAADQPTTVFRGHVTKTASGDEICDGLPNVRKAIFFFLDTDETHFTIHPVE